MRQRLSKAENRLLVWGTATHPVPILRPIPSPRRTGMGISTEEPRERGRCPGGLSHNWKGPVLTREQEKEALRTRKEPKRSGSPALCFVYMQQ